MIRLSAVLLLAATATAAAEPARPTVQAMTDELARSMTSLELPGFPAPYYLAYALTDRAGGYVTASLGALVSSEFARVRSVRIDLRVGDATFDNSNVAERGDDTTVNLPLEDDYDAVRRTLWLATDREYKHAIEALERKRAVAKSEVPDPDRPASFAVEPPSHLAGGTAFPAIDHATLDALARDLSAVLRSNPDVHTGTVSISAFTRDDTFVASDGSRSSQPTGLVRIDVD